MTRLIIAIGFAALAGCDQVKVAPVQIVPAVSVAIDSEGKITGGLSVELACNKMGCK